LIYLANLDVRVGGCGDGELERADNRSWVGTDIIQEFELGIGQAGDAFDLVLVGDVE
jgi:hypothetical protein